jgi:thiol:disulfide interchange protein DsbA
MNLRRLFLSFVLVASSLPVLAVAGPEADKFKKLANPVSTNADTVEVIEFFWYGCPHCSDFEPALAEWEKAKGKSIQFKRVPVAFREDFVIHQKLYYSLEALGKVHELHGKVFKAIHSEGNRLVTVESITAFIEKNGIDKKTFLDTFNSFGVASKSAQASQLAKAYQLDGVPTLAIDGQFLTSGAMAGTNAQALLVADQLIDAQRQVKKSKKR